VGWIIGLPGPFGAGCSEIADYLVEEKGFKAIKPREYIEEYAKREITEFVIPEVRSPEKRKALQVAGNIMRMDADKDLLGKWILGKMAEINKERGAEQDFVIDSLKNTREADFLREKKDGFVLVSVYSSIENRQQREEVIKQYEHDISRLKEDDRRDRDEFGSDVEWGQQVMRCDAASDISIDNDENVETTEAKQYKLHDAVNRYVLADCPIPDNNTSYMWQAEIAAGNSQCYKRHVGACIVKEDEILSVGWNRTPDGIDECLAHKDYKVCYRDYLRRKKDEGTSKEASLKRLDLDEYDTALIERITDEDLKQKYLNRIEQNMIDSYYYDFKTLEACRALHAEEMAILNAITSGRDLDGATIYTTTYPCMACAKKIAQLGLKELYFIEPYPISGVQKLLEEKNIKQYRYQGLRLRRAPRIWDSVRRKTIDRLRSIEVGRLAEKEVYDSVFQMLQMQEKVNAILGRLG
jgi:deoxycytidylate deaminase